MEMFTRAQKIVYSLESKEMEKKITIFFFNVQYCKTNVVFNSTVGLKNT